MIKNKIVLGVSSSIFVSWIFFEYFMHRSYCLKLKKKVENLILLSFGKYKYYYSRDIDTVISEIESVEDHEKEHTINCFKKNFLNRSSSNLESYINCLKSDHWQRKKFCHDENIINEFSLKLDNMLWYPYLFRVLFSLYNNSYLTSWNSKFNLQYEKIGNYKMYVIKHKIKEPKKFILIFIGMGCVLNPFDSIINLLVEKGYKVFIPIFGPTSASLEYYIEGHEAEYHEEIYKYISKNKFKEIEIISWSLGGILYKGFESFVNNCNTCNQDIFDKDIKIKRIFLFEPLINLRSASDTYFLQKRKYCDTLNIMNSVTSKKYITHNYIFSYFMHTIIGYSTCTSFGYLSTLELKRDISFEDESDRYLFLSSDDLILNEKLDKCFLDKNFKKKNIFYRRGYHGGWLFSEKLLPTLSKLI